MKRLHKNLVITGLGLCLISLPVLAETTGTGTTGNSTTGTGTTGNGTAGTGTTGNGTTGTGTTGNGTTGTGTTGNGTTGTGTTGNGTTGAGTTGNGTTGNGTTGNGTTGNGTTGNGTTGNGTTGSGRTGSGTTGNGRTTNAASGVGSTDYEAADASLSGNRMSGFMTVAAGNGMDPQDMSPSARQLQDSMQSGFDRLFMVKAAQSNIAEVATAQLALQKSRNPEVRQLAQRIIDEHGQANRELLALMPGKGLPLPTYLGAMHAATSDQLSRAKSRDFDRLYMAAQMEAHENAVTLFQQELTQGTDNDARAYAARFLPHILDHTVVIYQLARAVNAPGINDRTMALGPSFTALTTSSSTGGVRNTAGTAAGTEHSHAGATAWPTSVATPAQ